MKKDCPRGQKVRPQARSTGHGGGAGGRRIGELPQTLGPIPLALLGEKLRPSFQPSTRNEIARDARAV